MDKPHEFKDPLFPHQGGHQIKPPFPFIFNPGNLISIYTTLRIINEMKHKLGIEAALEYMAKYCGMVERTNPNLKQAVTASFKLVNIEKMYRDTVDSYKDGDA